MSTFNSLNISKELLENLNSLEFKNMTKIQEKTLPLLLNNSDVIAQAKTGSGKTISFSIPLVEKLEVKKFTIQSMVICPTRELANQVAQEIKKLCRHIHNVKVLTLCGGVPFKPQAASLKHKAHIVVGTPGRLLKHISENNIELENIKTLVLDEADKMLDMGFYEDVISIVNELPKDNRQTSLFSATFEENIKVLAKDILNNPVFIQDEDIHSNQKITQAFYKITQASKTSLIPSLISSNKASSVLIFCNRKVTCEELADEIFELGFDCVVLNSDLDQKQRDETVVLFSNKSYPIMIATDVASRGLNIDDIDLVINYDVAKDEKVHTHRIGRTARAQAKGKAITLYTNEYEIEEIKELYNDIEFSSIQNLEDDLSYNLIPEYRTLYINGGKKNKLRAGDIVGALIHQVGLKSEDIGNIDIFTFHSYVAIKKEYELKVLKELNNNKIKGKKYQVYKR
ncbi:ATP-dependent RNA helicase DbpA [Malaciobacter marinus]|uniref:ATP-dependent RNA helicase DbpA n=1 Tax=Malaciobacter marinus TaxID=505249 RepID=A0ABX4LWR9_9BACT|nr:ATP-dependent RNA helicase DbpA [Malaciobacter marinus]PHO12364.1 ATP-dependent RNA helicase DbpA [Malaciobacter marinus]PHO15059.1 ATP-dependent RNA helicase DbpA [Malaciobacter marinus]